MSGVNPCYLSFFTNINVTSFFFLFNGKRERATKNNYYFVDYYIFLYVYSLIFKASKYMANERYKK